MSQCLGASCMQDRALVNRARHIGRLSVVRVFGPKNPDDGQPHNALVIDPNGENAEETYEQSEKMGQAIHVLDPFGSAKVPDRLRASFNPLTAVDLTSNRALQYQR